MDGISNDWFSKILHRCCQTTIKQQSIYIRILSKDMNEANLRLREAMIL